MTQPANLHHKCSSTKIYTETKFTPDIPWSKNNHHLPSNFISSLPQQTYFLFPSSLSYNNKKSVELSVLFCVFGIAVAVVVVIMI
jgi:hypothetical protein